MVIGDVGVLIESGGKELTDEELIKLEEAVSAETETEVLEETHEALECFTMNKLLLAFHDIAAGVARFEKSGL